VVQLIGGDGRPVGYMKVGWNDLTRRLVRAEADMLRRLAGADPRRFTAPDLLHQGEWEGLDITVSSALPHRPWRRGRRYALPPVAVSREIAALGGIQETTLAESGWWARLRSRLVPIREALAGRAPAAEPAGPVGVPGTPGAAPAGPTGPAGTGAAATLDGTLARLEGLAGTWLVFGTWHGDWGPWNLRATPDRLLVWDWERSADRVPSASTCATSATRRPSRASASRRPPPPSPPGSGRPPTWPSWASGPGWPSCCATCTCWSGSAGPPRPRCRP
jgi:hypothetical protein